MALNTASSGTAADLAKTAMIDFDTAIARVLGVEGGYVNNPADPGGETNWGIAKRSYPNVDIKNLTLLGAKVIYHRDFWAPVGALVADPALQYQLLDAAVNHGMGNATRMLQAAVGAAQDGHWGPDSKARMAAMALSDVRLRFVAARFDFWASLKAFDSFGRGWARRGAADLRYLAEDAPDGA